MKGTLRTVGVYAAILLVTLAVVEIGSFALLVSYSYFTKGYSLTKAINERLGQHPWLSAQPYIVTGFNPLTQNAPAPGAQWTGLKVNASGYIDNGHDDPLLNSYPAKPEGLYRVVLLGGSSAAGVTAKSNRETIAAHLERQLNAGLGDEGAFQVLNFGVPGGYLFNELTRYVSHVVHLEPDIVIFFDGYNDALYASFEHVRQRLPVPVMNWADYSYSLFETMNNIDRRRRSAPPAPLAYSFKLMQLVLDRYVLGDVDTRRSGHRTAAYESYFLYSFSAAMREKYPFFENAIYENLSLLASHHIGKPRLFLAYLQASPLEFKDLAAELDDGLELLRAPVEEARDPEANAMFRKNLLAAFRRYSDVYGRLEREFAGHRNIGFRDIRRVFEKTQDRVYNDIIHTNDLGNSIIAAAMYQDIKAMLPLAGRDRAD